MLFNSWQFLIYLPIVFITYFLLPKKVRHIFLLVASYFFYMFWNWKLVFLILFTTVISYVGAILIKKSQRRGIQRLLLIISLISCLGVLIFFKYFNFMVESVVNIINMFSTQKYDFVALNIILPVGISFYTFQTLSYVIDVYNNKTEVEYNPFYYALYVSFFPQLVAGPIERSENLLPQFKNKEGIKKDNLVIGLQYILKGYIEKIFVADLLGIYVNKIFNNIYDANGMLVMAGAILFSIQILGDFAGYSDIAIGVAKLFNIDLMKNFDNPYKAKTIKEFWNKWHISLSKWLRDYIYFPMGGSRVPLWRWILNILVVFIISGIWHGAAVTFIIWGLMHAIYQIIGRLTIGLRDKLWNKMHISPKVIDVFRVCITYMLVCLAWIAFRSNSFDEMLHAYKLLFTGWSFDLTYFNYSINYLGLSYIKSLLIICPIIMILIVNKMTVDDTNHNALSKVGYVLMAWLVVIAFIYLEYLGQGSQFIYFQF